MLKRNNEDKKGGEVGVCFNLQLNLQKHITKEVERENQDKGTKKAVPNRQEKFVSHSSLNNRKQKLADFVDREID